MIKRKFNNYMTSLLPLLANGRARPYERRLAEFWLNRNKTAARQFDLINKVKQVENLETTAPSKAIWTNIQTQLANAPLEARSYIRTGPWRLGMGIAVLMFIMVWFVFPPKVVLEWQVEGNTPEEFHIYRSVETNSGEFLLVEEIEVAESNAAYQFVDLQLLPGRDYTYKIEAVSQDGAALASELILSDGSNALPGQLAFLLTLVTSLYGLGVFLSEKRQWNSKNLTFRTS